MEKKVVPLLSLSANDAVRDRTMYKQANRLLLLVNLACQENILRKKERQLNPRVVFVTWESIQQQKEGLRHLSAWIVGKIFWRQFSGCLFLF